MCFCFTIAVVFGIAGVAIAVGGGECDSSHASTSACVSAGASA